MFIGGPLVEWWEKCPKMGGDPFLGVTKEKETTILKGRCLDTPTSKKPFGEVLAVADCRTRHSGKIRRD